ncbi:MAG TPA: CoA pyrophosphatase [Anaerolineales bacterium]|nr:CoA pyrophosphatase [Anaerolineales bacterium]
MISHNLPKMLRERLHLPDHWSLPPTGERPAAVLMALYRAKGKWQLLLTRRTETVAEHKGQVAFPGGAADSGDRTRSQTALREAGEEIGLQPDDVALLGCLPPYSTVTGWHVTPVVGTIPHPYSFRVNPHEIESIFAVPLAWLADPKNHTEKLYSNPRDGSELTVFFFRPCAGHVIWGASAHMTLALLAADLR